MIPVRIRQKLVLFVFLAAAALLRADVNVLIVGSDKPGDEYYGQYLGQTPTPAFQFEEVADQFRQILAGTETGTVNVVTRERFAGSSSSHCNNLLTWFYWPYGEWEGSDPVKGYYTSVTGTETNRWKDLRGENGTGWDYVVIIGDPYTIETTPGLYSLGVAKIAEEVAKGTGETVLLMPWSADGSSTNLNHYREVVYRTGRTAGVPVAPAGLAWDAAGSPTGTNHPSADGAYIAAATLYSRLFGQSATNSSYNPSPLLASNAYVTVTANQGAPQYSGPFEFNNPFKMLGDKRRHVLHSLRGTSTEARQRNWLQDYILPDLNVTRSYTRDTYDSNTPDDDGLGWPYSGSNLPIALNYGRHQASAGDGATKSYFTNRDYWQLGFGFSYQYESSNEQYIGNIAYRDLSLAYLMKEGTISKYSYNLSAYDQAEEIASARLIPFHILWAIINREFPDKYFMQDASHVNRGLGRSGATFMYTIYSGRTPVEEDAEEVIIDGNVIPAALNSYAQRVGYETAWILGNVQARAPGLKVKPATSDSTRASETFSVRFFFPPQSNVTVSVSVSDPALAEVSQTNLVFTPENYSIAQEVSVRALQRNSGADETYDVQFETSSDDEVYDGVKDSWSFTLPANAAPSVLFTSPVDGAVFPNGDLTVIASASDPDGSVSSVTLWLNGQQVRQDSSAPYQWSVGDGDSLLANLADDIYKLEVTAEDNDGLSFSKTISITVGSPETSVPAAPTGLVLTPSFSTVGLDWDDNTEGDLESYSVYRSTNSGSYGSALVTGLTASGYTDNSVVNGITYYYAVTAVDVFTNESVYSAQQSAIPGQGSIVELFGSDFQGFAGFTTSPAGGTESWTTTTDSVHYAFEDANTYYASLLKSYTLDRSDGSSCTFEGVVDLTDGYGDDNNRIGIFLFSPTATQTGDNGGGLYLRLNSDDNNTVNIMANGVNGTSLDSASPGVSPGDLWIGQTLTFKADLVFTNISGTDKIDITFTLTDGNIPANTYTLAGQVNAANYQGTYFGFATRWRNRGDGGSRNTPPDLDYRSFRFTDNKPIAGPVVLWRAEDVPLRFADFQLLTNSVDPEGAALSLDWISNISSNGRPLTRSGHWITYETPLDDTKTDYVAFRIINEAGKTDTAVAEIRVIEYDPGSGPTQNQADVVINGDDALIKFFGIPGRTYIVQTRASLTEGAWQNVGQCTIGSQGNVVFTHTNALSGASGFYRTVKSE